MTALLIVGCWFVASLLLAPLVGSTLRFGLSGRGRERGLVPARVPTDTTPREIDIRIGV